MANPPSKPSKAEEADPLLAEMEMKLRGVDGGVKSHIIGKLRQLVDKNPDAVVKSIRHGWLAQSDDN